MNIPRRWLARVGTPMRRSRDGLFSRPDPLRDLWVSDTGEVITTAMVEVMERVAPMVGWSVRRHLTFVLVMPDRGDGAAVLFERADLMAREVSNGPN